MRARLATLLAIASLAAACGGGGVSYSETVPVLSDQIEEKAKRCRRNCTPPPAPTYVLTVSSPVAGQTVAGIVDVAGSGSGFLNVEVFANGVLLGRDTPDASGGYTVPVDTTSMANGSQTLTVMAWDSPPGQTFTQTKTVNVTVNVQNESAPPVTGVSLLSQGAKCDGVTDDTAAIVRGIAAARSQGVPLVVPAARCNYSQVLELDSAKITGSGVASVLYSTNYAQAAIFMMGAGPSISNLTLTGAIAPQRMAPWEYTKIVPFGATDFVIDRVTIDGSSAAGIQLARAATRGRITNNVVRNTLSDSIHMTDMASHVLVEGNLIENSGDDGIAVVSYRDASRRVANITARNNVVRNNRHGRNMSVVGGQDIVYENNYMEGNAGGAACLYIVQEGNADWFTYSPLNVLAERNTVKNCGSHTTGHGAIMVYSDGQEAVTNVTVRLSDIVQNDTRTGIRWFGPMSGVHFDRNRYTGSGVALDGSGSGVTVTPYTTGPVGYVAP